MVAASNATAPAQQDKHTSLAVTIKSVRTAVSQRKDTDGIHFYGTDQGMLIIVGAVESWLKGAASVDFALNDSTGRIKARYYGAGSHLDSITVGSYVQVFGNVRTAPELHFAVAGVRLVKTADEVSYHLIECAHSALKLQRLRPEPTTPASKKQAPDAASNQMEFSAPKTGPGANLSVQDAVLALVQQEGSTRPEGVSLAMICQRLLPASAAEVRSAVQQLTEDAEIFTTIDEEHFLCVG